MSEQIRKELIPMVSGNGGVRTILLDAGHGGKDPGAIGPKGTKEKDVALLLTHLVKMRLERANAVELTRYDDTFVSISRRISMANAQGGSVFVSIHCNAAESPQANGTEVFHYPGSDKGQKLATYVQEHLGFAINRRDRGVKTGTWGVLRHTTMPAILVEVAFISNPEEEELLQNHELLVNASCGIAQGILRYLGGEE